LQTVEIFFDSTKTNIPFELGYFTWANGWFDRSLKFALKLSGGSE